MKTLMILFAILALSFSQTPVWRDCDANHRQWTAVNVTLEQNSEVKELYTISACGVVEEESTNFNAFAVKGDAYIYNWFSVSYPRAVVAPGEKYCLNDVFYLSNFDANHLSVRLWALNHQDQVVGCVDIRFQNQDSPQFRLRRA